jgi:hypothetical protein
MRKASLVLLFFTSAIWAQATGRVNTGTSGTAPHAVRNDIAQSGEEIVTLRYFKIKKGSFDQFLKSSAEGVWPYFEKIGSRIVGMWQVIPAEGVEGAPKLSPDFDEVYLMTRYASLEHWAATRDAESMGGNGPDWEKCRQALAVRNSLTLATHVTFLKGHAGGGPYFMPGMK